MKFFIVLFSIVVVLEVVRICLALLRGRSVRLPQDTRAEDVSAKQTAVPPPAVEKSAPAELAPFIVTAKTWLEDIRQMTLLAEDGVLRLDVLLRSPLTDCPFGDLTVRIFLAGEYYGVEYVVKDDGVQFISPLSCCISLEPSNEWYRKRAQAQKEAGNFVSRTERIEFAESDGKQSFTRGEDGLFLPATTRAA